MHRFFRSYPHGFALQKRVAFVFYISMKFHPKSPRSSRVFRFLLAFGVVAGLSTSHFARADGTLVPAPGCFDFTHDSARGLVYISSGAQVLRYRLSDGTFLSPIQVGGRAQGLDISPDGITLAVADGAVFPNALGTNEPGGRIVLVNLDTLAQINKTFSLISGESGAYSLAYDYYGNALISPNITSAEAGFKAPLRRYYLMNNYVGTIGQWGTSNPPQMVAPRTVIARNNDGTSLGFAETGAPNIDWGIAGVSSGALTRFNGNAAPAGDYRNKSLDLATNGTVWFLPTPGDLLIRGNQNELVGTIGGSSPIDAKPERRRAHLRA